MRDGPTDPKYRKGMAVLGWQGVRFRVSPEDYEKLKELAGGRDVDGFCKERILQYIKWRHRDRRTPEEIERVKERQERKQRIRETIDSVVEGFGGE